MNITKQAVHEVLEGLTVPGEGQNLVASGALKNINVFGEEIVIDLVLKNPRLIVSKYHDIINRKRLEKGVIDK